MGKPMRPKSCTQGKVSVTEFESYEDEAEKIALALLKMGKYDDTAIIYRVNTRSLLFEQAFTRYRIPYRLINETSFFKRKVTRDLLSALKASHNPQDIESLVRIINTPRRGFGPAKKEQLLLQGRTFIDEIISEMPLIKEFMIVLDTMKGMSPSSALDFYLSRTKYHETLTKDSDHYMVSALLDLVVKYDSVNELILASSFLEGDSSKGVNLITAHSSKGLEFDRVFVVGVERGLWPHKNSESIKEEERLFYVACTRAKRYLNVSYAKSRIFKGNFLPVTPSNLFRKTFKCLYN
jgi:DNA helicase-2/ATP-dependent DNA helicase PcrA